MGMDENDLKNWKKNWARYSENDNTYFKDSKVQNSN